MIDSVSRETGVASTTLYNLAWSESRFNPLATSTTGDRGIVQINSKAHPEVSDECAFDPQCALQWAAERIKAGYLYEWTAGNCYSYVSLFVDLPRMAEIVPGSPPEVGGVAIYDFNGQKHLAVITGFKTGGFTWKDANRKPGLIQEGFTKWGDPKLRGFFQPSNGP